MIRRLLGNKSEERSLSFQDIWGRGLNETDVATKSGEVVNSDTAFGVTSVYAAVRLLSTCPPSTERRASNVHSGRCRHGWFV